ncbi:hypothetical protein GCM10012275_53870 [Longimycelium tulufanense]|uniref:DUF6802 domain-containing protein n=1 Tax=Longimycelium tulufanense TaxID=907463 RepID=A0A8J3CD81_9PSEU|nr:DUF6802 family protein [Longimycelium tulufanense]GGM76317.1 hypothetical protein GCM10012275_53870 [Longimycelium tulufanense]
MYIEDHAGDGDIKITVEGEEYTAEANFDADHDGVEDTALVETDSGYIAYTDTDHDGTADTVTQLDDRGKVVGQAKFDERTGEWVDSRGTGPDDAERRTMGRERDDMIVETRDGEHRVGAPTEDLNRDGQADTTVVRESDGDVILYTDTDGDGDADTSAEIAKDGKVMISEHRGAGEWEVVEKGHISSDGSYQRDALNNAPGAAADDSLWADDGEQTAADRDKEIVSTDPATGRWI